MSYCPLRLSRSSGRDGVAVTDRVAQQPHTFPLWPFKKSFADPYFRTGGLIPSTDSTLHPLQYLVVELIQSLSFLAQTRPLVRVFIFSLLQSPAWSVPSFGGPVSTEKPALSDFLRGTLL